MRHPIVWLLWALASLLGLAWGGYLCFFPAGMESTVTFTPTGERLEFVQPTYEPVLGVMVLVVLISFHALLGLALFARHYVVFGALVGLYIVLTICSSLSIGGLLRPSAVLLLVAAFLTIGLRKDDHVPHVEQHRHNGA